MKQLVDCAGSNARRKMPTKLEKQLNMGCTEETVVRADTSAKISGALSVGRCPNTVLIGASWNSEPEARQPARGERERKRALTKRHCKRQDCLCTTFQCGQRGAWLPAEHRFIGTTNITPALGNAESRQCQRPVAEPRYIHEPTLQSNPRTRSSGE